MADPMRIRAVAKDGMVNVKVLRDYERVSDVGVKTHRAHCEFHDLPDKDREKLVKFRMKSSGSSNRSL